jgi:hypothetical protein
MPRGMVWSNRVRDTQSATQVNTIRPGKLARLLGMREAKSVKSGTSGTHRARKRVAAGACRVVGGGMGVEVVSDKHGRPVAGLRSGVHAG